MFLPILLAYAIRKINSKYSVDQEIDQRLRVYCPTMENFYTYAFFNKNFVDSGVIGFSSGALLGHLFEMKYVKANLSYSMWNKTSATKTIIRILITLIIFVLFNNPIFALNPDLPESSIPLLWFINSFFPSFLPIFILFAFGRAFFLRLNLINERAIGGIFEAIDDGEMNETTDG